MESQHPVHGAAGVRGGVDEVFDLEAVARRWLEEVAPECNMSADELERFTLWHGPELGCYRTLKQKENY